MTTAQKVISEMEKVLTIASDIEIDECEKNNNKDKIEISKQFSSSQTAKMFAFFTLVMNGKIPDNRLTEFVVREDKQRCLYFFLVLHRMKEEKIIFVPKNMRFLISKFFLHSFLEKYKEEFSKGSEYCMNFFTF